LEWLLLRQGKISTEFHSKLVGLAIDAQLARLVVIPDFILTISYLRHSSWDVNFRDYLSPFAARSKELNIL
jgi:hypothetical protein